MKNSSPTQTQSALQRIFPTTDISKQKPLQLTKTEFNEKELRLLGLSINDWQAIQRLIGRKPNLNEMGIFAVMWSEHCSYKSTKIHLQKLPTKAPWVIHGPGENAGVVEVTPSLAVAFKMESHNHPSFIEPKQGSATGVGGILRDIFTMGARPIANANLLRFGEKTNPKVPKLLKGVTEGISSYGNAFGVPTVCGETFFHKSYNGNNLVNAMSVGLVNKDKIFTAQAGEVGNCLVYLGKKTGRDGILGASMASQEFDHDSDKKKPSVQVGDPFMGKCTLEATLEAMNTGIVLGAQDMGAAGLTCSSLEMASNANAGALLDLDFVPLREPEMSPYEILLSESQERMLLVIAAENLPLIHSICKKWQVECQHVGAVTNSGRLQVMHKGELVVDLPVKEVSHQGPLFDRPRSQSPQVVELTAAKNYQAPLAADHPFDLNHYWYPNWFLQMHKEELDLTKISLSSEAFTLPSLPEITLRLLSDINIASKAWIYEQYDRHILGNTLACEERDCAVVRLDGTSSAIAISVDCQSTLAHLNAFEGAVRTVAESALNVAMSGARPIGITNNLNFGNPEKPEMMWNIESAIQGIGQACKTLNIPVTGGNVSLYNETLGEGILNTPSIGTIGKHEQLTQIRRNHFTPQDIGNSVYLINFEELRLTASYAFGLFCEDAQINPQITQLRRLNLEAIHKLIEWFSPVPEEINYPLADSESAHRLNTISKHSLEVLPVLHDVGLGGLAVHLSKMCFACPGQVGIKILAPTQSQWSENPYFWLAEGTGVVIASMPEAAEDFFKTTALELGFYPWKIGQVCAEPVLDWDEQNKLDLTLAFTKWNKKDLLAD